MIRLRLSFVRNILSAGVLAVLLLGAPMQIAAQERESPEVSRASMFEWASGIWSDFTAWFTGGAVPTPPSGDPITIQGTCAVDPNGGCGH